MRTRTMSSQSHVFFEGQQERSLFGTRQRTCFRGLIAQFLVACTFLLHLRGGISLEPCTTLSQIATVTTPMDADTLALSVNCTGGSVTAEWFGSVVITSTIVVGADTRLEISGGDDLATVDGNSSIRLFEVGEGGYLSLESVTLKNGQATKNITQNLTGEGGSVFIIGGTLNATDCVFEDNRADIDGGCIFATNDSAVVVEKSVFRSCWAGVQPSVGDEDGIGDGGGIKVATGKCLIANSLFEDCYAGNKGGGASLVNGNFSVSNTTFALNSVGGGLTDEEEEDPIGAGGGLAVSDCFEGYDGGNCTVSSSLFENNYSFNKGGALDIGGTGTRVVTDRCKFLANGAGFNDPSVEIEEDFVQGEGGAASVAGDSYLFIQGSFFEKNIAGDKGGAISGGDWSNVYVHTSEFVENQALGGNGGAVVVSKNATLSLTSSAFRANYCFDKGGALSTSADSKVTFTNSTFQENVANEVGGVMWSKGKVEVQSGLFIGNSATKENAGVFFCSSSSRYHIMGGEFLENKSGGHGGCLYASGGSAVLVSGGHFENNEATDSGGNFFVGQEVDFDITGGVFRDNFGRSGGFMYVEGSRISCQGAVIEDHSAIDGGALYALKEAGADWACDCVNNSAILGGAMYILNADVNLTRVSLVGNTVPRGSVMFVVQSNLTANEVTFNDLTASEDLSAIQADEDSIVVVGNTTFVGFVGEAVVFNEGDLVLDSCDFSECSAPALVFTRTEGRSVIRNTFMGDTNYKNLVEEGVVEGTGAAFWNHHLRCTDPWPFEGGGSLCSGSVCVEGDIGVYCDCYSGGTVLEGEVCFDSPGLLNLTAFSTGKVEALFPESLTADLEVAAGPLGTTPALWSVAVSVSDLVSWKIFPNIGLLRPGKSMKIRVTGNSSVDGGSETTFVASNGTDSESVGTLAVSDGGSGVTVGTSMVAEEGNPAVITLETLYYHCEEEKYWDGTKCKSCLDLGSDTFEGLDCSEPGSTVASLPIRRGFWRSSNKSLVVRECFVEEACIGNTTITSVQDYCAVGYSGPFCAVCESNYGQGVGLTCHKCSNDFKGGMYFLLVVLALVILAILYLLGVYLIGGGVAVVSTMETTHNQIKRKASVLSISKSKKVSKSATTGPMKKNTDDTSVDISESCTIGGSSSTVVETVSTSGSSLVLPPPRSVSGTADTMPTDKSRRKRDSMSKGQAFLSKIPFQKIKIVIVVWQITTQFAEITQVSFPPIFEDFLSVISLINFDLGWVFSATCLTQSINFYNKLLMATIAPLVLMGLLALTYHLAATSIHESSMLLESSSAPTQGESSISSDTSTSGRNQPVRGIRRSTSLLQVIKDGPGQVGEEEKRRMWSLFARHATVLLILIYLIYTQVSTIVFQTFVCEDTSEDSGEQESYLRADFSIRCETGEHRAYKIYAAFMIFLYPFGIPLLFGIVLWKQKSRINPPSTTEEKKARGKHFIEEKKLDQRKRDKNVAPTSFLWRPYSPGGYYYEVVECGRRLILTGIMVFILPNTSGQVAIGCIFAFLSLVVFELLRPHLDPIDRSLYRTGCLVIFFTNFLALMIKAEVADADSGSSAVYSVLLILVNGLLLLSIWWQTWVTLTAMFSREHVQDTVLGFDVIDGSGIKKTFANRPSGKGQKMNLHSKEVRAEPEGEADGNVYNRDNVIYAAETGIIEPLGGETKGEEPLKRGVIYSIVRTDVGGTKEDDDDARFTPAVATSDKTDV